MLNIPTEFNPHQLQNLYICVKKRIHSSDQAIAVFVLLHWLVCQSLLVSPLRIKSTVRLSHWYLEAWSIHRNLFPSEYNFWTRIPFRGYHVDRSWWRRRRRRNKDGPPRWQKFTTHKNVWIVNIHNDSRSDPHRNQTTLLDIKWWSPLWGKI